MAIKIERASAATVSFTTPQEVVINQADDSIKAYLYDSAGNGITSTLVGGKRSVDANVTASALPAGAATENTLTSIQTLLTSEFISGQIEAAQIKTYTLDQSAIDARTLQTIALKTLSGTATITIKIDGISITGMTNIAVSNVETVATASAFNSVAVGQTIDLVVTAVATPIDLVFTLKYIRI